MKPLPVVLAGGAAAAATWGHALGRVVRTVLALAVVVLLLVATGVIHLPSVESIVERVGMRLGDWAYLLVGVNAFLETGAFLGFIAPGETVVLFGGVLAGAGTIDLAPLIAVTWGSAMLGDLASYAVGRRYGRDFLLRHGARVKIGEPQVQFVEGFFERHGFLTVFLGRWIGVVRPLVPFLAGSTRLAFPRFLAIDVLATATWSAGLCVVGSVFWRNFDAALAIVSRTLFVIGAVVAVMALLWLAVHTRRSEARNRAVERWLAGQRDEHPFIGRPATAVWAAACRFERHAPGRRRRSPGVPGTVPDGDAPPSGPDGSEPSSPPRSP